MGAKTAKIFRSGNSQTVRIPREFQLEGTEVEIERRGDALVLRPKRESWKPLLESLTQFTDDFMERDDSSPPSKSGTRPFHEDEQTT
jgi:antitoxin VapB